MTKKIYVPEGEETPASQIGTSLEVLAATIAARREAGEESYTYRLLTASPDKVLKKLMEESGEVALAAKDVESWATSSVAAALAFESGAGRSVEPDELSVQLPPEYDEAVNHLRYEAADVVYHLMVVLERYGISMDELAAEMNARMAEDEIALHEGMVRLRPEHVNRGK